MRRVAELMHWNEPKNDLDCFQHKMLNLNKWIAKIFEYLTKMTGIMTKYDKLKYNASLNRL